MFFDKPVTASEDFVPKTPYMESVESLNSTLDRLSRSLLL